MCGTIPDPRPAVDSKLKLLDEALRDLEMGQGNNFLSLRGIMLDAQGQVRKELYKPNGDIHLSAAGTRIVSLRIQNMLNVMLPIPVPVQAPVQAPVPAPVVNAPPVVSALLVAAVVNAPVVVQHVAVAVQDQVESPMEVEDEDSILQRLFFKKYGRALPDEKKKDDVDINFVIDLTDGSDEMEVATSEIASVVVVKTEQINANQNAPNAPNVAEARKERRECVKARKAIVAFGKTLRKSEAIPEKEAPEIVANTDMAEANPVESIKSAEQINAETEAEKEAFEDEFGHIEPDEFDKEDESEFQLYPKEADNEVIDADEAMIDDV